ncbi:hypothetical protein A2G96_17730 [Cupriavidus nantongensis]|uniref:Uncharacterized protein n=1 Tax=Cupriavidus nantongensis TaxID=1796606 RepID=A0A142JMW8_9BURK|nr:hypothetical protein A2G96_17730 [Cupriavidus nantongensis]
MDLRTEHPDFEPVKGSSESCEGCHLLGTYTCNDVACCGWDFPEAHPRHEDGYHIIWVKKQ